MSFPEAQAAPNGSSSHEHEVQQSPLADSTSKEPTKGHVLLIDDSVVASKMALKVLEKFNFEVTACNSAQEGYDTLIDHPTKFSVVFLDVVMPKVDGVECLSWIKDVPEIAHVPVYMLSALEDQTIAGTFSHFSQSLIFISSTQTLTFSQSLIYRCLC